MIKKVSNKQSKINRKLKEVYQSILDERPHYCSGCGRSDVRLSFSHIIPRSRRKDLETNPDNITFHCLSSPERIGCHNLWEGTKEQKEKLLDYHQLMSYILETDPEYYFLLSD